MNTIIVEVLTLNRSLKVIPILNKVDTNPKISLMEDTSTFAKNLEHIYFSKITIGYRVIFRRSVADGLTVPELKTKKDFKAIYEINALYKEVFNCA